MASRMIGGIWIASSAKKNTFTIGWAKNSPARYPCSAGVAEDAKRKDRTEADPAGVFERAARGYLDRGEPESPGLGGTLAGAERLA